METKYSTVTLLLGVARVGPETDDGRDDLGRDPREFWREDRCEFRAMRLLVGHVAAGRGDGVHVVDGGGVKLTSTRSTRSIWLHPLRSIQTRSGEPARKSCQRICN